MSSRACTCFVGNLPGDIREREVEDIFYKARTDTESALRKLFDPLLKLLPPCSMAAFVLSISRLHPGHPHFASWNLRIQGSPEADHL